MNNQVLADFGCNLKRSTGPISAGAAIGAMVFACQYSLLQTLLFPQEGFEPLNGSSNPPAFGAVFGGITGLSFFLLNSKKANAAAWIKMIGGFLTASFIIDMFAYGWWEYREAGFAFPSHEIAVRCIPEYGSALPWSVVFMIWGASQHYLTNRKH